jgi:hypothetical protein
MTNRNLQNTTASRLLRTRPFLEERLCAVAAGDFIHITFTISAGRICGFVNGVRSGDCSGTLLDANRQLGTGEPLEIGGEESYTNHVRLVPRIIFDRCVLRDGVTLLTGCHVAVGPYHQPLWSMASVVYYDRALSEQEVALNYAASQCLELETHCP